MVARVEVLPAAESDMEAINAIYNHYVPTSDCTMETEPVSLESRLVWFYEHRDRYPIIVARFEGEVVGWASLSKHRARAAYRYTAEDAVYVREDRRGMGIGTALLTELVKEGRVIGLHSVVAVINAEHRASLGLHRKVGFEDVALIREAGFKFGRWVDIRLMQLML